MGSRWQLISVIVLVCVTQPVSNKAVIQVGWLVPFTSHPASSFLHNASSSVAALALGIETVQDLGLLPDYDLNITFLDTGCSSKQSLGVLVDQLFLQQLDVVIGPACAHVVEAVGELLAYRDIPLLNWLSIGQTIYSKVQLNTYIRTMAPVTSLGDIMTLFYYYTGWRRLVIVSTEGDDYKAAAATIITSLGYNSMNGFHVVHHYSDVNTNASNDDIDSILNSIIHEARIIILSVPRGELRTYMLQAATLGMVGGDYQFLYTDPRLLDADDEMYIQSNALWRRDDDFDDKARQAFENVLYFALGHTTSNTSTWAEYAMETSMRRVFGNRTDTPEATWLQLKEWHTATRNVMGINVPDEHSPYLHDTIVLYASILNRSLSMNWTKSGIDLFALSNEVFFKGLSGDVTMNHFGDRQPTFFVYDLNSDGRFHKVASLQYTIDSTENRVQVNSSFSVIIWGDGQTSENYIPPDTPACGFFKELCPPPTPTQEPAQEDSYEVVIASVSATMLIVLLVMYLIFRWWRWERDLKNMTWKLLPSDLNHTVAHRTASATLSGRFALSNVSVSSTSQAGTIRSGAASVQSRRNSMTGGQIFASIALYKGETVAVKNSRKKRISIDRAFLMEAKHITEMKHVNVTHLVGICTVPDHIMSAWEYCSKGSIQDVIENDDIPLDTMFKLSLAIDTCQGLEYIHKSALKYHGNLKSSNCVIDNRWVCKLTDFGLQKLRPPSSFTEETLGEHACYARLFWTAPELLRNLLKKDSVVGNQAGDIYSLAVILKEIVCRNQPFSAESRYSPKDIIMNICKTDCGEIFRPAICDIELDSEYRHTNMEHLIRRCWSEDIEYRPSIKAVLRTLNKINPYKKASVVDNMLAMMEKYTNNLEDVVAERTEQLEEEKRKTDALLYRMLPKKVADDLKFGRAVQAEAFDAVTIYFSDIVRFTDLASESTPLEIVALLNALYTLFDDIIEHYDVYKVETIGDAYMIVSGLPERNANLHVREMASVALQILQSVLTFHIPHIPERQLQIRIGLHTGPVVAGVVGLTMPRYCLFGDTVNTASRMESNGKPQMIHMSASTKNALLSFPEFHTTKRGEIEIKGKGTMTTYWLSGRTDSQSVDVDDYGKDDKSSAYDYAAENSIDMDGVKAVLDSDLSVDTNIYHRGNDDATGTEKLSTHSISDNGSETMDILNDDRCTCNETENLETIPQLAENANANFALAKSTECVQLFEIGTSKYDFCSTYSQNNRDEFLFHENNTEDMDSENSTLYSIKSHDESYVNADPHNKRYQHYDYTDNSVDEDNLTDTSSFSSWSPPETRGQEKYKTTVFYMESPIQSDNPLHLATSDAHDLQ